MNNKINISTRTASTGEVAISCVESGGWRFSAETITGDVEIVRVVLDSEVGDAVPPKFKVSFSVAQGDVRHVWHPDAAAGFIPPEWDARGRHRTRIASMSGTIASTPTSWYN